MRRRVVVTGLGAVTPLGLNVDDTWRNMLQGRSGVGPVTKFDAEKWQLPTTIAAEVKGFDPTVRIDRKELRKMDLFIPYALFSAMEALELGLVNKVLPHEELIPHARETALKLIPPGGAILAFKFTKRALHQPYIDAVTKALDMENEGLNKAVFTSDFLEAGAARKEKRAPVFKGE